MMLLFLLSVEGQELEVNFLLYVEEQKLEVIYLFICLFIYFVISRKIGA